MDGGTAVRRYGGIGIADITLTYAPLTTIPPLIPVAFSGPTSDLRASLLPPYRRSAVPPSQNA